MLKWQQEIIDKINKLDNYELYEYTLELAAWGGSDFATSKDDFEYNIATNRLEYKLKKANFFD